jgi:YHS domain-containing protein
MEPSSNQANLAGTMTPLEQTKKPVDGLKRRVRLILLAILAVGGLSLTGHAAVTERVVTDRHTGLALYGVDPVAYFTDGKPVVGKEDFEYRYGGVTWRFGNEGNRAAFAADPAVYMPRFGGYDPAGIARGVARAGYPQLWAIVSSRLYLFYTADARAAFIADPGAAVSAAEAHWADVARELPE